MSIPVRERVRSHRRSLRATGLKRLEVIVPADKANAVKKFVAQLRQDAEEQQLVELRSLLRQAFQRYGASCLDNIRIDSDRAGRADVKVVADALMKRGNADAFKLGRRIAKLAS